MAGVLALVAYFIVIVASVAVEERFRVGIGGSLPRTLM